MHVFVAPTHIERLRFRDFTPAALRKWSELGHSGKVDPKWVEQLADALDAGGFTRIDDTPPGWGWTYSVEPTSTAPTGGPLELARHITPEQVEKYGELSPVEFRALAAVNDNVSLNDAEWFREVADALDISKYLYLHEADEEWGWTVRLENGTTTVLHETWTFPEVLHDTGVAQLTPKDICERGARAEPFRRLFYFGLATAMRFAGYGKLGEVPYGWQYQPQWVDGAFLDRDDTPLNDAPPTPATIDPDFLDDVTRVRATMPDSRVAAQHFGDEYRRRSVWDLRERERISRTPDPVDFVWDNELADALDTGGFRYFHETPAGWGWTVRQGPDGTRRVVPTSSRGD